MTRIEGVPARQASPLVRLVYRLSKRRLGREVDPVPVYAHTPALLLGYGMFEQATGRLDEVDGRLKALAVTKAAALVSCEFCCDIASALAREAGITEQQLLALARYRESGEFSELELLVLDYATAMSRTPASVSDELFAALREHFDERQLVELTNEIALENMRARFNTAFAMTPAGFSDGMVCAVPERGEPDAPAVARAAVAA
ncbi:MAG TPA: carboxymuconolactone decarboxylase family protein [Solirubrobacteraceae bacterium]|nr:carboxymuconolactone decarboxylase family protein [Solirubrobacteraceae bacterium]